MVKLSIPFDELRTLCRNELKKHEIKTSTVDDYQRALSPLISFMEKEEIIAYTPNVGENFMRVIKYDTNYSCANRHKFYKSIRLLNFFLGEDSSPLIRPARIRYEFAESFKDAIEMFLLKFKQLGRSENTMASYQSALSKFSIRMAIENATPSTLTRQNIVDFFSTVEKRRPFIVTAVKYFCLYLHHEGFIVDDFQSFFRQFGKRPPKKLLSYYTPDEINRIESSINRDTEIGKRDYAMILLASRLGLRSSDIRALKFSNIDWDKQNITIVQYKTQRTLTLPLLNNIGDAIVDYIKNSRPKSSIKRIFITHSFPYDGISTEFFHNMITSYIKRAEVFKPDKKHGPHSLRHSLATNMLNNGEQFPVISAVLGHSTTASTMDYLTVDVTNLLRCSLDVPPVNESFYKQGGGLFYDYD